MAVSKTVVLGSSPSVSAYFDMEVKMDKATIDLIQTDMGNGGAFCSNCDHCLDGGDPLKPLPEKCPKCDALFVDKTTFINQGGSDF
jgi:hypothetical protein